MPSLEPANSTGRVLKDRRRVRAYHGLAAMCLYGAGGRRQDRVRIIDRDVYAKIR
jgi:hypothetical protein